jgi:sigma-B regulation protein RsbU (phosphoserine phosphatase)
VVLAITPLATVTVMDLRAIHAFGQDAAANARRVIVDNSVEELRKALDADAETLARRRAALAHAAWSQAHEIERRLAQPWSTSHAVYWPGDFDAGGGPRRRHPPAPGSASKDGETVPAAISEQVLALARGVSRKEVAAEVAALADMGDVYRLLKGPDGVRRQYSALECGLQSVYPGYRGAGVDDARQLAWYRAVRAARDLVWLYAPAASGHSVVATVCAPVKNPDGTFGGVTGLDAPLDALVETMATRRRWPRGSSLFILGPSGREGRIEIIARMERVGGKELGAADWDTRDRERLDELRSELVPHRSGWRTMSWRGEMAFWVYACAGPRDLTLLGVLPPDAAAANVRGVDEDTLARMRAVLVRNGLLATAVLLLALLAAVLGARFVTRPLRVLTNMAGWLAEGRFDEQVRSLRPPEMRRLVEHLNEMGPKLRELERMGDSLQIAMVVQQSLLPQESPRLEGFDIAGRSVYCDETGGDYFDFIGFAPLGPPRLGIAVGDVAGHGVAAALLMATARGILRSLAAIDLPPAEIVTRLNRVFSVGEARGGRFMTLLYLVLDSRDGSVRSVRAGHEPAVVYDAARDRFTEVAGPADIAMGIKATWSYREAEPVTLALGQTLVAGTDGIWECRNPAGEPFGRERFLDVIRRHAPRPASEIAEAILDSVDVHRGTRRRDDDVTLVVVKSLRA